MAATKRRIDELIATARRRRNDLPPPEVCEFLRVNAGLSQDAVAEVLEVDRASVSRYETGTRSPRGEVLDRYTALLERLRKELA